MKPKKPGLMDAVFALSIPLTVALSYATCTTPPPAQDGAFMCCVMAGACGLIAGVCGSGGES